jgi:dethiobiotin synthetase
VPRVVVLGCGTGVGKTRVAVALLRELGRTGHPCIGVKPIESGFQAAEEGTNPPYHEAGSDASALAEAGSLHVTTHSRPLYGLAKPISPHLAAREVGVEIQIENIARWVTEAENAVTLLVASHTPIWRVIESAGGVFSPLSAGATNLDLARALEPAIWIVVAGDSLGVLHEVTATLQAMRAVGRSPDHVVLSAAREPDASTGTNARELHALGIVRPSAVLQRDDDLGIRVLVQHLLAEQPGAT